MRLSAAIRTRSDGEWRDGAHYGRLEIGREVMNSLTKVAKDTLVIEVNELDTVRPETDEKDCEPTPPHPSREGEAVSNTLISTLYKNPPHVVIPYDCDKRPEEKFQTSQLTPPKIAPTCMAADYKDPQLVFTACVTPVRKI